MSCMRFHVISHLLRLTLSSSLVLYSFKVAVLSPLSALQESNVRLMELEIKHDEKIAGSVETASSNVLHELANYTNPNNVECAQSRVLRNHELLELVMWSMMCPRYLEVPFPESSHLLWASLTCKDFYDPAMNVLWETIVSWVPVIRLISVVAKSSDPSSTLFTITEPISEEHLLRMDSYVRRIRTFVLGSFCEIISPQIYVSLAKLRNFQIFPALVKLRIRFDTIRNDDIPSLSLMPSPTLSVLDFVYFSSHPVAFSLLHDIPINCSNIREINLDGKLDAICFNLLGRFRRLESLKLFLDPPLTGFSAEILRPLSGLKNLKNLEMHLEDLDAFTLPEGSSSTVLSFESLRLFRITSSAATALRMLQMMSFKLLHRVSLFIMKQNSTTDKVLMGMCFEMLVQMHSDTLQELSIRTTDATIYLSKNVVKHMTQLLSQLERLELDVDYIDKETLDILATSKCHPTLRFLHIRSHAPPLGVPYSQVSHIASFASLFPVLQQLCISAMVDMGARHVQAMRNITMHSEKMAHPLRTIMIFPIVGGITDHQSNISVSDTVSTAYVFARYLHHYFPHLKEVEAASGFGHSVHVWCQWVTMLTKEVQEEAQARIN